MKTKHTGPNVALLRRLARKLRRLRHEKHYDQKTFGEGTSCGTAACIAGHAVLMCGYKMKFDRYGGREGCISPEGRTVNVCGSAARLLGFDRRQYEQVFSGIPDLDWPDPFKTRWRNKDLTPERPSRIAADYLDHLADMAEAQRKTRKRKAAAHAP